MSTLPSLTVREISSADATFEADMADIDSILMRAYNMPSRRSRVERYLGIRDRSWAVVEDSSSTGPATNPATMLAVGGYIASTPTRADGGFGWVGLIATDPNARSRGAATMVTQWAIDSLAALAALGCASVLDASAKGAPVYERMAFDDHGWTTQLSSPEVWRSMRPWTEVADEHGVREITIADLDELSRYDSECFGGSRRDLFAYVFAHHEADGLLRVGTDGRITGYVLRQENNLGPFVADTDDDVDALLDTMLSKHLAGEQNHNPGRAININVPAESRYLPLLVRRGFRTNRALRHMRLGLRGHPAPSLPGRRDLLVGQSSFGEG